MLSPGQEVDAACIIVRDRTSTNLQLGVEEVTCGTLQSHGWHFLGFACIYMYEPSVANHWSVTLPHGCLPKCMSSDNCSTFNLMVCVCDKVVQVK